MSSEVFISYSSRDRNRVMPVVDSLRGIGISVWMDEGNIHAADLWTEQIVQAISDCHVMVVMLSRNSTDSHNVVKEVMLASEQKKTLLPVFLEPASIPAKLQYQLAGIQHLELYGQDEQQVLKDLANGLVKRGISREGEAIVSQATTVKRHEKPRTIIRDKGHSINSLKITAWSLITFTVMLIILLLFRTSPKDSDQPEVLGLGRMQLNLPIPMEYPMIKPSDMPFGVPFKMLALSPNANYLVYVCMYNENRYLCLVNNRDNSYKLLTESKGGLSPFFSPDEKWIGFVTANHLKKIELSSGLLKVICDASNPYMGTAWGSDGIIYFGDSEGRNFYKVSDEGGTPELLTDKINSLMQIEFISTLSGSKLLFRSAGPNISRGPHSIYCMDLNSDEIVRLGEGQTPLNFENNLITVEDGQIRVRKFDANAMKVTGEAKTLVDSKIRYSRDEGGQLAMSKNNVIMYLKGISNMENQLTILDPKTSKVKPLLDKKEVFGQYSISPNGKKVAVEVVNNQIYDIQILDLMRSRLSTFTNSDHNYAPFWSVDGKSLYYASNRENLSSFELYIYSLSKRTEEKIPASGEIFRALNISDVSSDGKSILCFGTGEADINSELYIFNIEDGKSIKLTNNKLDEWGGVLSDDENWIAYSSEKDMKGGYAIYLNKFPEMDNEIRISAGGGEEPKWLPNSSDVYYRNGSKWMKVPMKFGVNLDIGEPEFFFEGNFLNPWGPSHDVFPDGRILLLKGDEWIQPTEIDVIINAFDEGLKKF